MCYSASLGDHNASAIIITKLLEKERFLASYNRPASMMPNDGTWSFAVTYPHQCLVTAPKPDPTTAIFVVGGKGPIVIYERQGNWHRQVFGYSDILSVDWLDDHTFMTGERRGAVRLWDTRSNGTSLRFQTPSVATHIKKLGEQRIVVAGLQNNVNPPTLFFPPRYVLLFSNLDIHHILAPDLRSPLRSHFRRPWKEFSLYDV